MSLSQRALINAANIQPACCFDISRDSQSAAVGAGRSIQIWQLNTPQMTATFEEHTGAVTCISYSPNGEFFASGAEDKTVIVYNLVFSLIVTNFKVNIKQTSSKFYCSIIIIIIMTLRSIEILLIITRNIIDEYLLI